jgi:hypothetical protein
LLACVVFSVKTLEFWIDNLNPSYLMPLLEGGPQPMLRPIMTALCDMMKPPPAANGQDAMRVLGKLGGSNRTFMEMRPELRHRASLDAAVVLRVEWQNQQPPQQAATAAAADGDVDMDAGASQRRVDAFFSAASAKSSGSSMAEEGRNGPDAAAASCMRVDDMLDVAHDILSAYVAEDTAVASSYRRNDLEDGIPAVRVQLLSFRCPYAQGVMWRCVSVWRR